MRIRNISLIGLLMLVVVLSADADRRRMLLKLRPAGGGPDAWYDVETSGNADTYGSFGGTDFIGSTVTVAQAGTATKIRLFVQNLGAGTENLKLALYSNSGTLLASGSVAVLTGDDDVYKEVILSPSVSVTATTYILAAMGDSTGIGYKYKNGSGAMDAWTSKVYADFPYDPIGVPAFDDLTRNVAISLYVD